MVQLHLEARDNGQGEHGEQSDATSASVTIAEVQHHITSSVEPENVLEGREGIVHARLRELQLWIANLLQVQPDSIGIQDDLVHSWGMDSIRMMSLVERFRAEGAEVTFVDLAEQPTLASWAVLLDNAQPKVLLNGDYF